jgi:class 3 adenylate cyclase
MKASEQTKIDRSLHDKVTNFARQHETEFVAELNSYVRRYFLKSLGCFFVALLIASTGFMIAWKLGIPSLVFIHIPSFAVLVSYRLLSRFSDSINRHAVAYFNCFMICLIVESTVLYLVYHAAGKVHLIDHSAAFAISTAIWTLNFLHHRPQYALVSGSQQVVLMIGVASQSREHFQLNLVGFVIGMTLGVILNVLIQNVFRYKFYFSQIEKRQTNHAYRQLEKVVYPHQRRQIEAGATLEQTMPVGWGEACVLVFDIVQSSQIKNPYAREFLQSVLKKCQAEMMYGYDGVGMTARAYRIKEMGDGFICSIGFPFRLPAGGEPAAFALQLARAFIAIVDAEAQRLHPKRSVFCSIGIAYGAIESFYPTTYPKEYDLYGAPIVQATRYEALRKSHLAHLTNGHLIILQDRVYRTLAPEKQQTFTSQKLDKQPVRDDEEATEFHYAFIPTAIFAVQERDRLAS